jgi:hypothetical protein
MQDAGNTGISSIREFEHVFSLLFVFAKSVGPEASKVHP